ncbi:SOS response-associated peptidase [Ihubacter massiliensis]|uniref:Abasic site processing protein n=1 Tax=Hominibacterium faecale TaxID=2839743 RepID=A0A9J6QUM7_9FIRM|nr:MULTISPECIES: SOS response-associated peptidase [Eubacteriales Family XIII. Incertae Sedis]MCO7121618.1 SOS response-associated peptidase [Ihubacter massiliensis]MCU7378599.1 SOS response-associated peptidase [Hominibacterium faecale]
MCGRYTFYTSEEYREMNRVVRMIEEKYGKGSCPSGDIYPDNRVPILVGQGQKIDVDLLAWGFPRWDGKGLIINARSETAAEKKTFAYPLKSKRCIIPSTGFYEWKKQETGKGKDKYYFTLPGKNSVYMAGLFNAYEDQLRFVILTTGANASMAPIHHRMPLILENHELKDWLFDDQFAAGRVLKASPLLESRFLEA